MIKIASQTVNYFPENLGEIFPEIEEIWIQSSKLKELNRKDLAPFSKLTRFYLNGNLIRVLHADLFKDNPRIQKIDFSSNPLKVIGKNILSPLKNLKYGHFSGCFTSNYFCSYSGCSSSSLSSLISSLNSQCAFDEYLELFAENEKIKEELKFAKILIEVKNEKLTSANLFFDQITDQLSTCSLNLQDPEILRRNLNLHCKYNSADQSCQAFGLYVMFQGQEIDKVLDLNGNSLSTPVNKLIIKDKKTKFLPTNLAEKFPNLTEVIVTESGLNQIDKETFERLTSLTSIKITHNKISKISHNSIADNKNLRTLDLSFNEIENIEDDSFARLGNLLELNLQNNLLTTVNAKIFTNLNSLQTLNLKSNKISALPPRIFKFLQNLLKIDISCE